MYWAASKHVVLEVDVLNAEKVGKQKDLSDFDKVKIVMARSTPKLQILWDVPSLQWLGPTKRAPRKEN